MAWIKKNNPAGSDVYVERLLGNYCTAYFQQNPGVHRAVAPITPVGLQSGKYATYNKGDLLRAITEKRAEGTRAKLIGYRTDTSGVYFCDVFGIAHPISDERRKNSTLPIGPDRAGTKLVSRAALLRREKTLASTCFTESAWNNYVTGVASSPSSGQVYQWSDYTNSDPISDLRTGIQTVLQSTGFKANTLTLGMKVWNKLIDHPDVLDRIKYTKGIDARGQVTRRMIADLLELENDVVVSEVVETTSNEGAATTTTDFVIGKSALLTFSDDSGDVEMPSACRTFVWSELLGAVDGARILKWRDEPIHSDVVEIEDSFDIRVTAADLGYFFKTIVA